MNTLCSVVTAVDSFVPEKVVTNEDLSKIMDTTDEWITERTGIKERHQAEVETSTSELGIKAAKKVFEKSGFDPKNLELIVAATVTPDYYFPGIGVLVQRGLGLTNIPAIDIRGQCSAFAWGITTADAYLRSGFYKSALVIGSEIHSRMMEYTTRGRNFTVLFGDGAGVMLLEAKNYKEGRPTAQNTLRGVIDHEMGSDGSGAELLILKRPGFSKGYKEFFTVQEAEEGDDRPHMEGRQVFRNAVERMYNSATALLKRNGVSVADIDLVIPHQANMRINESVREKLGLPPEKVFNNIQRYGNTTSATLPICMTEAEQMGRLKKGMLVMTLTFGSGFTWGANLIRW